MDGDGKEEKGKEGRRREQREEERRGGKWRGGERTERSGEVKETEVLINIYRELNEFGDWKKLRHCGIQDLPIYC